MKNGWCTCAPTQMRSCQRCQNASLVVVLYSGDDSDDLAPNSSEKDVGMVKIEIFFGRYMWHFV